MKATLTAKPKTMEANELRIGNYVKYNGMFLQSISIVHPAPRKGSFNDKWIIDLACDGFITATLDEMEPITLTEEWLVKFGFEYEPEHLVYSINNQFIIDRLFTVPETFDFYVERIDRDIKLKYVHQLQNLYFALTGEELKIKQHLL